MGDLSRLEIEQRRQYWQGEQKARSMLQHYDPRLPLQGEALAERARIDEEYEQAKATAQMTIEFAKRGLTMMPDADPEELRAEVIEGLIGVYGRENLNEDYAADPNRSLLFGTLPSAGDPTGRTVGGFSKDGQTFRTPATHKGTAGPGIAHNVPESEVSD